VGDAHRLDAEGVDDLRRGREERDDAHTRYWRATG
jgi:hypothetical protein